jgi:uncharacterized membrane protein
MTDAGGSGNPRSIHRSSRRRDGFRERGDQVTRLETFVDAAFAFAVTLLVIGAGSIPDSVEALIDALERVPAFAAAFLVLVLFWTAHGQFSRRYGLDDRSTTALSLLLVFLVLIFVYPLRMVFESFFAWISLGRLSMTFRLDSLAALDAMFITYGLCFGALSAVIGALYMHAWREADAIGLDAHERAMTLAFLAIYALFVLLALISISIALGRHGEDTAPVWSLGLPGMVYSLMFLAWPVGRWVYRRAGGAGVPSP